MIQTEGKSFFQYETSGKFYTEESWKHPSRILHSYELIVVLDGEVFIEENGVNYTLSQNEMLILEPGKRHSGFAESVPPTSFYWMHFQTDMEIPFKTYSGREYYDVKYLLKKILHISNTPTYPSESAEAVALMIFYELSNIGKNFKNGNHALVKEIAEYARVNVACDMTVTEVAEHFRYNADYISKLFKHDYGIGLKQFMVEEKLKKAKDLLLTSGLSVKEIAAKLGYRHENLFIKFFMYHEKISPKSYRNTYFNIHINKE